MWEKLRELHKANSGADFYPDLYGNLDDEHLLNERIKSKGEVDAFMRLLYVITIFILLLDSEAVPCADCNIHSWYKILATRSRYTRFVDSTCYICKVP